MSLKLYISNNIDKLSVKLADNIKLNPLKLFQKEYIVVQTDGMGKWISIKMAEKNRFFGNFDFFSPNSLLFELFHIAEIYNPGLYETNNLKWIIYKIIGSEDFKNRFNTTYLYFEKDRIKQLQLSTKIADLFDQYIIYRPDYIRNWNDDESPELKQSLIYHEKWQRWIWLKVKDELQSQNLDKVQMRDKLLQKFENDIDFAEKVKNKFSRISLFGFSIFTFFHIEVLSILKDIINIDFYLVNPAPEVFWLQDIPEKTKVKIENYFGKSSDELNLMVGNQLMMNQGRTAKDMFLMLFNIEDFINVMDNESLVKPPDRSSLLHIIQNEIYYNTSNQARENLSEKILTDGTVQISSNYTAIREVETLYNYLLKQIEENDYRPNDIIVQTTNIDLFTPIIKAVFDNASIQLPYIIADRSYSGTDNLVGILKQLMSLQKDEFSSEDILQLLEFDVIRKKFGINNLKIIRNLVDSANIRHGIDGDLDDDTLFVSWKYGLERILLGYAINDNPIYSLPNQNYVTIPLDIVEGENAIEGLKLIGFVNTLISFIIKRNKPRKLAEWHDYVLDFIDNVMEIGDDKIDDLNYIYNKLSSSNIISDIIDNNISYEVFFTAFVDSLFANNRVGKFISGSITFCSMIPMRSVPYKVVAILGLNKNTFPRKSNDISFDLMLSKPRPGDRNLKETDKYLFFEAILSASEKLYLSYVGQSVRDNSEIPPSPVIDELLDYISLDNPIETTIEKIVTKHTLNNYNKKYYDRNFPRHYTYLKYGSGNKIESNTEKIDAEKSKLDKFIRIADLLKFYKNPIAWYFNKKLNIFFNEETILLPETEKFELDNLDKYLLKNEIIKHIDLGDDGEYIEEKIINGELPLKNMATYEIISTKEEIKILVDKFVELVSGQEEQSFSIETKLNEEHILSGEINSIYGNQLILVNFSSDDSNAIVKLQLYRWICSMSDLPIEKFILLHLNRKKQIVEETILYKTDINSSTGVMNKIIKYYSKGFKEIVPFYPKASVLFEKKLLGKTRSAKTPLELFINTINIDSEYDLYLKKIMQEDYFSKYNNIDDKENDMLSIAEIFFEEILL